MGSDASGPWTDLLAGIVPDETDVGLLQAMLWEGEAARARWAAWAESVRNPKAFFEEEFLGRKGLLAFLSSRITANGIDAGQEFATYARVALVREELRSRIFADSLRSVQSALDAAGLDPILINGAAYALTVYPDRSVRHNHGIDLVLPEEQLREATRAVAAAGFLIHSTATLPQGVVHTFQHGSGLELTLRSGLFLAPHVQTDAVDFRLRCRRVPLESVHVRVLHPTDMLCHTFGETASGPARRNLRWACDAFLLLTGGDPFDFGLFQTTAGNFGIATPAAMLLDFFARRLRVAVPAEVIEQMLRGGVPGNRRAANLLLSTALRSSASVDGFVARACRREGVYLRTLRFAFLPSAEHIAYQQRPASTAMVPLLYVLRAMRLLLRPVRRLRKVIRGARRGSPARRVFGSGR